MKVTLLDDDATTLQIAVTGGYHRPGYHQEIGIICTLELILAPDVDSATSLAIGTTAMPTDGSSERAPAEFALPTAKCTYCGPMTARANHTATYVPGHRAGPRYRSGYLLLFGGNVGGRVVNTIDILDLEDMTWEYSKVTTGELPCPRNSHSALLLPTPSGDEILIMGGGTGDDTNGGPPRGGCDLHSCFWLHPESFSWRHEPEAGGTFLGRGHLAVNLSGTAVVISGGRFLRLRMSAFRAEPSPSGWEVEAAQSDLSLPLPRILGGGCSLPDGTILIYAGWHPVMGTFADLWAAHVDGVVSPFCEALSKESKDSSARRPIRKKKSTSSDADWCRCITKIGKKLRKGLSHARSWCFGTHEYDEVQQSAD